MYLHPSGVNVEREVAISDLEWRRLIVDKAGPDNVELRNDCLS
jgi:hypothetical protein